ncbi:MAG TPA: hypothetical protein DCE55_24810 [Planctomycetaceae bacterium]|nr:hypothetical protein [Planctomycetaceae bacterium]|tara:strand:+ start:2826 stop:3470 length:645 start_codon:yes stop_codon:yes gene_type:complete
MPLLDVDISINGSGLPSNVVAFLREAELRVSQFVRDSPDHVKGFVPSDFVTVYRSLRAITEANLAAGTSLCEWGSGFGVVASLAAMLEFQVCGIEIERALVNASRRLADDFCLPVEFVHGSFVPSGAEADVEESHADSSSEYFWLVTDADDTYDELGRGPHDFDVVFAYPWPAEECLIEDIFEKYAAEEALLLTYTAYDSVRLRRKVRKVPGSS